MKGPVVVGSDAEVFIFDHNSYITKVVPTFHRLLLGSRPPDWLYSILRRREIKFEDWKKTDIVRFCTYLGPDFSWGGPYDLKYIHDIQWDQRSCRSEDCPERLHCPFHRYTANRIAEEVLWLFQCAVSITCLGRSQFVGRSMTADCYGKLLSNLGLREDDRVMILLAQLGKRGFVIGYQFGFGHEGINGWLDPLETTELAARMEPLPLPRYDYSFEAMVSFRRELGNYECPPGASFEALSLSFVRTVAAIASREKKGILLGNDVMSAQFYQEQS
jgi:hypothetical protein